MRITIEDLRARARTHAASGERLRELFDRRRNVNTEAEAEIAAIISDASPASKAYRLLGRDQHASDAKRIAAERLRQIEPHLARDLYQTRHNHGELESALRDFEIAARRAPGLEDLVAEMAGGESLDGMMLRSLVQVTAEANLRAALPTMPPSQRLDLYRRTLARPRDPVSVVTVQVLEADTVPYAGTSATLPDSELTAATALGRAKAEAQGARVPDVSDVREILQNVARVLHLVELAGVRAVNPGQAIGEPVEELPEAPAAAGAR